MSGRPKQGIDYSGWSVNIFDGDTKIDKLLDAQGWIGFSVYFYLCQMAYKFDGYFYRWCFDDSSTTARRMGGGLRAKSVEETVRYCLQIGLFDRGLFEEWNILTSRGIQRRYLAAIQGRRVKSVISNYWLLNDEESGGLLKCTENDDLRPANAHLQAENSDLQDANVPKRKVKQRKGITPLTPLGVQDWGFAPELTEALSDWLKYKAEKRQGYQDTGLKALKTQVKNNAARYGEEAVARLIRDCMAANWRGIIFDRLKNMPEPKGEKEDDNDYQGYTLKCIRL